MNMKQVDDKYSIAWFKLADCIARGEKERALGVYRLLSHSLDDTALARQLWGDILLSFKDENAKEKYEEAAQLYEADNRLLESAAVYEHLATLHPNCVDYREKLIQLYGQLRIASKVREYVHYLLEYLLTNDEWQKAIEIVREYDTAGDATFAAQLHEKLVFTLVAIPDVLPDTIMFHVKAVIDMWKEAQNENALDQFMKKLEVADEKLYKQAQKYN